MFCLVFAFSAAFTAFIVLTICLSVMYFVYDFIINKINKYDRWTDRIAMAVVYCVMLMYDINKIHMKILLSKDSIWLTTNRNGNMQSLSR